MVSQTVTVSNPTGLHARPAAMFVKEAQKYQSALTLEKDGKTANGRSMIAVMSLGAGAGSTVTLSLEGEDEQEALKALVALIESGFGE